MRLHGNLPKLVAILGCHLTMTRTCQPWMGSTASTLRWLAGTSKEFIRLWGQREGHMSRQRWCTFNHDQGKKYGQSCRHLTAIEALCQPVQGGAMFFACHREPCIGRPQLPHESAVGQLWRNIQAPQLGDRRAVAEDLEQLENSLNDLEQNA